MLHTPTQRRRIISACLLVLAIIAASLAFRVSEIALQNPAEWSGWTVLFSCVVLLIYAMRKRLSTLPLGRVAIWLQVHIYLGVFCLWAFALHIDWRIPGGWFEIGLSLSFVGTIITGLLGLYWCRTLPTQLTRLGDEVMYERIPGFVRSTAKAAEEQVLGAVEAGGSKALADFHKQVGHAYFAKPRFQWMRLIRTTSPSLKIQQALTMSRRFMAAEELVFADKVGELIDHKNRLDAHYTWQGALKQWLFVHLAFSLSLVPMVALHVILAYNFALS